jgi:hypothetical protein
MATQTIIIIRYLIKMLKNKMLTIREALIADDDFFEGGIKSQEIAFEDDGIASTQFLSAYNEHMWRLK